MVEAAGRGGGQAVRNLGDKAAIEALGIAKPGLRFGTRNASVRLPGTGALEEALSGALNRARAPLTNTGAATQLRKWGRPATSTSAPPWSDCSPARARWVRWSLPPTSCRPTQGGSVNGPPEACSSVRPPTSVTN